MEQAYAESEEVPAQSTAYLNSIFTKISLYIPFIFKLF